MAKDDNTKPQGEHFDHFVSKGDEGRAVYLTEDDTGTVTNARVERWQRST